MRIVASHSTGTEPSSVGVALQLILGEKITGGVERTDKTVDQWPRCLIDFKSEVPLEQLGRGGGKGWLLETFGKGVTKWVHRGAQLCGSHCWVSRAVWGLLGTWRLWGKLLPQPGYWEYSQTAKPGLIIM